MGYLLPAAVLVPAVAAVLLSLQPSRTSGRSGAWLAATATIAVWIALAAATRHSTRSFSIERTPWNWGSQGPSVCLDLELTQDGSFWLPVFAGALLASLCSRVGNDGENGVHAAVFGIAACAAGLLTAKSLILASACLVSSTALAPVALRSMPISSLSACLVRPLAADLVMIGGIGAGGADAKLTGGVANMVWIGAAMQMAAFPFGGWIVQLSRRAPAEAASLFPWMIACPAVFAAKWLVPAASVAETHFSLLAAGAYAAAALTSFGETRNLARFAYLISGVTAVCLGRLTVGDQVPAALLVCIAAAVAPAASDAWKGGAWHLAAVLVWMIAPFALCGAVPRTPIHVRSVEWITWVLTAAGCLLSAISLSTLVRDNSDDHPTNSAPAIGPIAALAAAAAVVALAAGGGG